MNRFFCWLFGLNLKASPMALYYATVLFVLNVAKRRR